MTVAAAARPDGRLNLTIAATSLGFVLVQLDVSIVNVALPRIATALDADVHGLQWVVDAHTIAFPALLLSAGAIGDRLGARRAYIGGFALFVLASIGCGTAPSAPILIAARTAQGLGAIGVALYGALLGGSGFPGLPIVFETSAGLLIGAALVAAYGIHTGRDR